MNKVQIFRLEYLSHFNRTHHAIKLMFVQQKQNILKEKKNKKLKQWMPQRKMNGV